MKVSIVFNSRMAHHRTWSESVFDGFERHGLGIELCERSDPSRVSGDFVACWGWRCAEIFIHQMPVLVFERGFVGDRFKWTSAGWNGLNGRATFPAVADGGKRWAKIGRQMKLWSYNGSYILVIDQVPGDASLYGVNLSGWIDKATNHFLAAGERVVYRPHPLAFARGYHRAPLGAGLDKSTNIDTALLDAKLCVTFNSNAGVDAILAGIPTIATDEGSMVWSVAAHELDSPAFRPNRDKWAEKISYAQWTTEEIESGFALDFLLPAMPV